DEYGRYVARFLHGLADPAQATPGMVHAFAYAPTQRGTTPRPSTVMVRLAAVHGYYDLARRVGMIERNPAADVRRPRTTDPRPKGLSSDELRALLNATPRTPPGARDRAAILTAVLTGLRRSELLGLTVGDIETKAGRVFYSTRTKGGHMRYRELPAPAWQAIRRALIALGTPYETLEPEAPLFPISGRGFAANLRRYAKRAGLEGVTPHVLRHSAAKLRRETGASIEEIGTFLGHRSLHTTSVYLRQLEGETDPGWHGVAVALGLDGEEVNA
ncbi:MAG TPA: tyrosine-type recombinase/integrase, partial [Thermomicrobiales bacterium]|nr:tyrosine-type recombinase/integrase [Thermomicrobiales bacterium]